MADPWMHRSENMTCKTCMWFTPKAVSDDRLADMGYAPDADIRVFELGRCRRHAPTMCGYPVVFVNDWCGDHKLDENKLGLTQGANANA